MSYFLHGDCQVVRREIPKEAKKVDQTDRCLAYGEVTGHAHRISSGTVEFLKWQSKTYLRVIETALLTHEEHKPIELLPGDYEYSNTTEFNYDEMESRRVAD